MNYKSLTDIELISKADGDVRATRLAFNEELRNYLEIEARKLYSSLGYKSLFEFMCKRYQFSEAESYRRIEALRLLQELPEVEEKIESGELSLTHINVAQKFFRQEKKAQNEYTSDQKLELLELLSNTSTREAEKIIASIASEKAAPKPDRIRAVTKDRIEIQFEAPEKLRDELDELKALLSNKFPNLTFAELIHHMATECRKQWSPSAPKKRRVKTASKAQICRDVFAKANDKCENCGSKYFSETDHIIARAKGGGDESENLRVFCRNCNQRAAILTFGQTHMEKYLTRSRI